MKSRTLGSLIILSGMALTATCPAAMRADPNSSVVRLKPSPSPQDMLRAADPNDAILDIRVDYIGTLNERIKKGSDPNLNAEPFYAKAFQLCVDSPAEADSGDVSHWPTELSGQRQAAFRKWVESNSEALAQLTLGTQKPNYWFQYQGSSMWDAFRSATQPKVRKLAFALAYRAKIRAVEGNTSGAIDDIVATCRLGLDLRKRCLLTEQLVGLAVQGLGWKTAMEVLDRVKVDARSLQSFQSRITELSKSAPGSVEMTGDEFLVLDVIQLMFGTPIREKNPEIDAAAAGHVATLLTEMSGTTWTPEQVRSSMSKSTPEELAHVVKTKYSYYSSIISKTPLQWKRENIAATYRKQDDELRRENPVVSLLAPAVDRISQEPFRAKADMDSLATVVALLRYKNDKGSFPTDLRTLVSAGYLPALPMDPYSDGPLVYKRTDAGFTLYSVGVDFKDDAGKHSDDWGWGKAGGDFVFWPVQPLPPVGN